MTENGPQTFPVVMMLLSFLIVLWLGYVKAQGEDGIKSRCVAPQSYIDDTASITCSFSVDLFKESKAFRMYRYDLTRSSSRTANELIVLDCFFRDFGVEDCSSPAPGYRFNGTFTDQVTVTIPSVTPEFQGRYECRAEPSYPKHIVDCVFLIKAKPTTQIVIAGRLSEKKNDADNTEQAEGGSSNTTGIVVGVVVAVLVLVGGIVLFVLWKREVIRLPCIKEKQHDNRSFDVESPDQAAVCLLPPVQSNAITTGERPERSGNDSGENTVADSEKRQNDETEPRPVAQAAELHEDAGDSSTSQDKVYVATRNMQKTRPTISDEASGDALANPKPSTGSHDMELCSLNGSKKRTEDLQEPKEVVPRGPNEKQAVQPAVFTQSHGETAGKTVEREQQAAKPKHDKQDPVTSTGKGDQTAEMSQHDQGATAGSISEKHDSDQIGENMTAPHSQKPESKGLDDNIATILRSARQPGQIYSDTNHGTANLQFYQNFIKCLPDGEFVDDIHKQWQNDPDLLERKPDCVQWLFPTSEDPTRNEYAQMLNSREAKAIKADKRAFARFLTTYKLMLRSYGLKLVKERTGEVKSMENCAERFKYLQNTHNYLRITRVLHCLGEMGLEHYKKPLIEHILMEAWQGNLRNTLRSCHEYWIPTVVNVEEQKKLRKLYKDASSCQSFYKR